MEQWSSPVDVKKIDDERQMVFGWFSVAVDKAGNPVVDSQGDVIESGDLEKAAYDFVLHARRAGEMHEQLDDVGRLVESVVFTAEKRAAMGIPDGVVPDAWWGGFKIDDSDAWKRVKARNYVDFSIGGTGSREQVTA